MMRRERSREVPPGAVEADASPASDVLFEGQDLLVRGNLRRSRILVVTFSSRGAKATFGGHRSEGFGERLLATQDVAYACFINKRNHWWQTHEALEAIKDLKTRTAGVEFERIITYGASMGAYGALLFSRELGATDVLACSPQYSISGQELPIHPTWREDMRDVPILFEPLRQGLSFTARITVAFDPLTPVDLAHARALELERPVTRFVVPFSGHSTALFLAELSLLKPLVLDLVNCGKHPSRLAIRAARRQSVRYWSAVAARSRAKDHRLWAVTAAAEAAELALRQPDAEPEQRYTQLSKACSLLCEGGHTARALELAQRYASCFPGDFRAACLTARILRRSGRRDQAMEEARRAKGLAPVQALPRIELACCLLAGSHLDLASQQLLTAIRKRGGTGQDWVEAAAVFEEKLPSTALEAVRRAVKERPKDPKLLFRLKRLERTVNARVGDTPGHAIERGLNPLA